MLLAAPTGYTENQLAAAVKNPTKYAVVLATPG